MRRGITKEKSIELVKTIREKVPGITIRTTLIAGYPGETETDFEEMKEWVEATKFNRLGIFTYSHEENTHAFNLVDDVSDDDKRLRAAEVMQIQQGISADLNETMIGRTVKVLVDRKEGNYFIGRTEADSPEVDNEVLLDAATNYARIGHFVNVRIDSTTDFDLFGTIV